MFLRTLGVVQKFVDELKLCVKNSAILKDAKA